MFFSLITLLSIIKFVAPCQGINGCTLCNHYATCIQCDSHHKLQHDVCVYDPQPTSTLNQPHRTNQNHIPTSLTITSRNPRATEFSINHNTGIQNSMSMTLVFSGVGARHQIVEDNCGFRYSGICIFCVQGYKLERGRCIQNFRKCLSFDSEYRCRKCSHKLMLGFRNMCYDRNCQVGNSYRCIKCRDGFDMDRYGICEDVNCTKIVNGRCVRCVDEYYINEGGLCSKFKNRQFQNNSNIISTQTKEQQQNRGEDEEVRDRSEGIQAEQGRMTNTQVQIQKQVNISQQSKTQTKEQHSVNRTTNEQSQSSPQSKERVITTVITNKTLNHTTTKQIQQTQTTVNISTNITINNNNSSNRVVINQYCDRAQNGICVVCRYDLYVLNGQCIDLKCNVSSLGGQCQQCKPNYQLNQFSICQQISVKTQVQQQQTRSEYKQEQKTLTQTQTQIKQTNTNALIELPSQCVQWKQGICLKCAQSHYLTTKHTCQYKTQKCKKYKGKVCTQCIQEYRVYNEKCILNNMTYYANCQQLQETVCMRCSDGYFINENGNCTKNVDNCQEYSHKYCIECDDEYELMNRMCKRQDINCIVKDLRHNCMTCKSLFYPKDGFCEPVDPLCKGYDRRSGDCTQCYQSYKLQDGQCVLDSSVVPVNCVEYGNGVCSRCANRYIIQNGQCRQVSKLCNLYHLVDGQCLSCYEGYDLVNGLCESGIQIQTNTNANINKDKVNHNNSDDKVIRNPLLPQTNSIKDQQQLGQQQQGQQVDHSYRSSRVSQYFCKEIDKHNNICLSCYNSFYLKDGQCIRINPLCKTYDQDGNCLSCYQGFILTHQNCQFAGMNSPQYVENCKLVHEQNNLCVQCRDRYFLDQNKCVQVLPQCEQYHKDSGVCTSCYDGYFLAEGRCVFQQSSVPYCQQYNEQFECVKCVSGYYVTEGNSCSPVSVLCDRYDPKNGNCLSCIGGYFLYGVHCIQPALGEDKNCIEYDEGGYCRKCKSSYQIKDFFCIRE